MEMVLLKEKKNDNEFKLIYMPIGLSLGLIFGSLFDNSAIGLTLGMSIGLAIDSIVCNKNKK